MDKVGLSDAKTMAKKTGNKQVTFVSDVENKVEDENSTGAKYSITLATSVEKTSVEAPVKKKKADDKGLKPQKECNGKGYRAWCITLNNWTTEEYENIVKASVRYIIVAKEVCPTTGTPHLQMYVEFNDAKTMSAVKKHLKTDRLHLEQRRGTSQQASDYCRYADYDAETHTGHVYNDFYEFGNMSQQGSRTDWEVARQQLLTMPIPEVVQEQPQLLPCIRALERFKQLSINPIERDVEVIVFYGDAGSGKTRGAYTADPDLYSKPTGDWWDGYNGETTILLDDFYGTIKYCEFLKVLDRYKYRVPVKGGFVGARWNKVFITSNKHPRDWYAVGLTPALKRRINKVYHLILNEDGTTTQTEETLDTTISHRRMGTFYSTEEVD